MLWSNLAPDGAVIKFHAASPHLLSHSGRAVVFGSLDELEARVDHPALPVDENLVLVLSGAGPVGGPGMPEVGQFRFRRSFSHAVSATSCVSPTRG